MQLTEDQILALAPDEASKKAGKDLSTPSKWVCKGINEQAIWGECQGSGSKPYETQVDIVTLAFKCSCPSRKFPCKHGLGLLLFNAKQANSFTDYTPPPWVTEWLAKRTEKEEKKVEQANRPVDEVAQNKRVQAREQSIEDGVSDVLLWMKDTLKNDIIHLPKKGTAVFDTMAKLMIDAKAPGLAGMIKSLGRINFYEDGWESQFLQQITNIYLSIAAFKNRDESAKILDADVRNQIGFTQNQEALKNQARIEDHWLVLGKQTTEEDNVTTERNWLYGITSYQYALVLQFSVRGQGITFSLTPGMYIQAELVFFPSVVPLRAIIKKQIASDRQVISIGLPNWQAVLNVMASNKTSLPFTTSRPIIVQQLTPVLFNQEWFLQDISAAIIPIHEVETIIWKLLALSGGKALQMALIVNNNMFQPIGVWVHQQYINL